VAESNSQNNDSLEISNLKLKESEEKFRAYSNQTSEGVTVADMEGNYVFVNPAFCKMSGYTEEELLKLTVFDMKAVTQNPESFADSKEKSVGKAIRVNLQRKDGSEYLTEIIGDVINVGGKKLVLGTIRDITQQVKDEEEIKKLNENLEALVQERTQELDKTIEELKSEVDKRKAYEKEIEESLHIKEVLLREITHRVKNNLQIISSLLNLQKDSIDNTESINLINKTANRIQSMALIHETLYNSKEYEHVNIENYISSLVDYVNEVYEDINIGFDTTIDELDLSVDAATSCGMIIMELVSNSIKYAFNNISNPNISIKIKKLSDKEFSLVVTDNGVGFPEDIDFKNTKSLGLQIIVSLVEQNNGEITLSRQQPGTCFEINMENSLNV
jgi:PAS domain S-box-containing protein